MLALLFVHTSFAACPSTDADLGVVMDHAEAAFIAMDLVRFRAETDEAKVDAACLSSIPSRSTTARLHRVEGLRAFVDKDFVLAGSAFRAARALEPAYVLPEELIPAGHPVRQAYAAADPKPGLTAPIPTPEHARVLVDGTEVAARPTDRPGLVMIVADDGRVATSAYVWPADPWPAYPVALAAADVGVPMPAVEPAVVARTRRGPNVPLLVSAGLSTALSGTMLALSHGSYESYYAADAADPDRPSLRTRTNAEYATFVGAGLVALGCGVGAVVAGRW